MEQLPLPSHVVSALSDHRLHRIRPYGRAQEGTVSCRNCFPRQNLYINLSVYSAVFSDMSDSRLSLLGHLMC